MKLEQSVVSARLSMCAAALAGSAAVVPTANASIVTFSTPIAIPATFAGVYVNLGTGASGGSAGAVSGWDFNPYAASGLTQLGFYWGAPGSGVASTTSGPYLDLPSGSVVGAASTYTNVILGTTGSPYLTTGTHVLGFQFMNEGTSSINYGFMTIVNTGGGIPGFASTITSWSYDNTGAPITTPGPAGLAPLSIAALAFGSRRVRGWRRQVG